MLSREGRKGMDGKEGVSLWVKKEMVLTVVLVMMMLFLLPGKDNGNKLIAHTFGSGVVDGQEE